MATPKIIPYTVKLRSVVPEKTFSKPPVVYTNDLRSAEFQFKITDMDATELVTATAKTMLYMRDGSFFQNPSTDVSRVGNVFSYLLKENEGNHAGIAKIQLVVYFNEGLANEQNFPTQLYEFEIINGLETRVAQEVMIYDWTTLTRDARAYIDQFVADEMLREAEFDNNEFDRNATFNQAQTNRTTAYGIAEAARDADYEENEALRQAGYDADHSRADTDHTRADDDHDLAGTDHTTAENDHTIADTDHTRAETDHTRAEADSATVAGFNARLTAEEIATANNKISAVKGKTFADVDARFEDVEADTTMMATNLITNGDFSNGTTGWTPVVSRVALAVSEVGVMEVTANTETSPYLSFFNSGSSATVGNHKYYHRVEFKSLSSKMTSLGVHYRVGGSLDPFIVFPSKVPNGDWQVASGINDIFSPYTLRPVYYINFVDQTNYIGEKCLFKNPIFIDLTATFGAGNEPTAEQMDAIMAKFPNSWFNGTANLFQAKASLNKLMEVDARTEFELKNGLVDGDMASGTAGWSSHAATLSASGNTLSAVGLGTGNIVIAGKETQIDAVVGNKLYIRLKTRIPNVSASSIQPYFNGTNTPLATNAQAAIFVTSPVINQYYTLSAVVTVPSGVSGKIRIANRAIYPDATTALNSILETQYVCVIDLTATFGAGKEPTLAEMDRLMARFPNSWFDGVKPIQTIETLYQEKANKVQEAWITPTLLNGWATVSNNFYGVVGYMKDSLGFVHVRGAITGGGAIDICALPIGYRPEYRTLFGIPNTTKTLNLLNVFPTGEVRVNTTADLGTDLLINITFKAKEA